MTYLSNTFTKNTKKVVFLWLEDKLFRCSRSCHMRCFFLAIIIIKCSLHRGTKKFSDFINPVCIRRGIRSSTLGLGRFMIYMCIVLCLLLLLLLLSLLLLLLPLDLLSSSSLPPLLFS